MNNHGAQSNRVFIVAPTFMVGFLLGINPRATI